MNQVVERKQLTSKREAFCQAIVNGVNQTEAYRSSFNAENMLPATINSRAYDLINHSDIKARIAELKAPAIAKVSWTFEDALQILKDIAMNSEKDADRIAAVREANKMKGFMATQKYDIVSNGKEIGLNTITIVAAEKQVNEAIEQINNDDNLLIENDADYIDVE
jgi:phage terminase small subunit